MATIKNLTPHTVHILTARGAREIASAGVARAIEQTIAADPIDGVPTVHIRWAGTDLPDPVTGTWLVVSTITAEAALLSGREVADLLTPGMPVRDSDGRIVGCRALVRYAPGWAPAVRAAYLRAKEATIAGTSYEEECELYHDGRYPDGTPIWTHVQRETDWP